MNGLAYKSRFVLVRIGKILPFVVCILVALSYFECIYSTAVGDFVELDGFVIPNKPLSWAIGRVAEYNIQMLVVLSVISVAMETCIYNKAACLYLGVNLLEKAVLDFELEQSYIYAICITNIIVVCFLTYKGVFVSLKH